jgi:aspartate/methionine/tyrosine aminotransferase
MKRRLKHPYIIALRERSGYPLLLEVGGVAATAGTEFGACGEGHLRFTLRVPPEKMPAVAAGIAKALAAARAREA